MCDSPQTEAFETAMLENHSVSIRKVDEHMAFEHGNSHYVNVNRGPFVRTYEVTVKDSESCYLYVDTECQPNEFIAEDVRASILKKLNLSTQPIVQWVDNFPEE